MARITKAELHELKGTLDSLILQAKTVHATIQAKQGEITSTNSEIQQTHGKIKQISQNAEKYSDNFTSQNSKLNELLSDIKEKHENVTTYYQEIETLKITSDSLKKNIDSILDTLNPKIQQNEEYSKNLQSKIDDLEKKYTEINNTRANIRNTSIAIKNHENRSNELLEKITSYHVNLFEGIDENAPSIKQEFENLKNEIEKYAENFNQSYSAITEAKTKIWGADEERDEDGNVKQEKISGLMNSFDSLYADNKVRFKELSDQIEGLLPDAASAGLASSYEKSYMSHVKQAETAYKRFVNGISFLVLFALIPLLINIAKLTGILDENTNWYDHLIPFLSFVPIILPLTWFALSQQRTMRMHQRMAEEYLHKKNLSQSYVGFQEMTEKLKEENPDSELHEMLLGITIEAKRRNASFTMDAEKHKSDHPAAAVVPRNWKTLLGIKSTKEIPAVQNTLEEAVENAVSKATNKKETNK